MVAEAAASAKAPRRGNCRQTKRWLSPARRPRYARHRSRRFLPRPTPSLTSFPDLSGRRPGGHAQRPTFQSGPLCRHGAVLGHHLDRHEVPGRRRGAGAVGRLPLHHRRRRGLPLGAGRAPAPALWGPRPPAAGGDGPLHVLLQLLFLLPRRRLHDLGPAGGGVLHDRGAEHPQRLDLPRPPRGAAHPGRRGAGRGRHRRAVLAGDRALRPCRRRRPRPAAVARRHAVLLARQHRLGTRPDAGAAGAVLQRLGHDLRRHRHVRRDRPGRRALHLRGDAQLRRRAALPGTLRLGTRLRRLSHPAGAHRRRPRRLSPPWWKTITGRRWRWPASGWCWPATCWCCCARVRRRRSRRNKEGERA